MFAKNFKTVTYPRNDVIFDDFMDLDMASSKETQIHSITCYHTPLKVLGFEVEYYLDGGRLRSVQHIVNFVQRKTVNVQENKLVGQFKRGMQKQTEAAQMFAKKSVYFENGEFIVGMKLKGQSHINKIEIRTNMQRTHIFGGGLQKDKEVDLVIPPNKIVIAFAGVVDFFQGECRLLNLSAIYKTIHADNKKAKSSQNFRELTENPFYFFDIMRNPEIMPEIKRI